MLLQIVIPSNVHVVLFQQAGLNPAGIVMSTIFGTFMRRFTVSLEGAHKGSQRQVLQIIPRLQHVRYVRPFEPESWSLGRKYHRYTLNLNSPESPIPLN